jgi:hypothetical protein
MRDPFHEPKVALVTLQREITAVNSLGAAVAPSALTACEQTVGVLYEATMGQPFPYQSFTRHKPGQWLALFGVNSFYSHETQRFLTALDGYSLDKVRFPNETAFRQYTNAPRKRANEIVTGLEHFIVESQALLNSPAFLSQIKVGVIRIR